MASGATKEVGASGTDEEGVVIKISEAVGAAGGSSSTASR